MPAENSLTKKRALAIEREKAKLPEPLLEKAEKRLRAMPLSVRLRYLQCLAGEASPRKAIQAFCDECVAWTAGEVAACTDVACPLYAYRLGPRTSERAGQARSA